MRKPTTGFVVFTLQDREVTAAPVYEDESPWGDCVAQRAKRMVEFERIPVGVQGSNPFHPEAVDQSTRTYFKKIVGGLEQVHQPASQGG